MLNIKNIKCTGCRVCYNICPVSAITMVENKEGFLEPIIDKSKCIKCGLCLKSCPQFNDVKLNQEPQICYAMTAQDSIRYNSSSGGIFSLFAEYIIKIGGYVVGASFSEDFKSVEHIIINNIKDLDKLRTSKYVQSNTKETYKQTKALLDNNKTVLYVGTPCEISGLNSYLGEKEYPNLFTIDILCHGVPSPKVWRKYLEEITDNKKIISANFRSKKYSWDGSQAISFLLLLLLEDNSTVEEFSNSSLYYRAFLQNLILRESCTDCKYSKLTRPADITLGDFWGIEKFDSKINDNKGISLIIFNNNKGEMLINKIKKEIKISHEVPIEYAVKGNPVLSVPCRKHVNRDSFFENIDNISIQKNIKESLNNLKYEGVIDNYWYSLSNYGAVLSAYAVQRFIEDLGYKYSIVNHRYEHPIFSRTFVKKFLRLTQPISSFEQFKLLNEQTDNFVIGTDQMLPHGPFEEYFLAYTDTNKKRIMFSASWGYKDFKPELKKEELYTFSKALKRFDFLSMREDSGVNLCKEKFDVEAEHIIDPVLFTKKEYWNEVALLGKDIDFKDKLVTYILDETPQINKIIENLAKSLNCEIYSMYKEKCDVETFVKAVKESKYFITDSFHGFCYSLVFHKPVICKYNSRRGGARFDSLKNTFNLNEKIFIENYEELETKEELFINIDWQQIDNIISENRKKAEILLGNALQKTKTITSETLANELDFIKNYCTNGFIKEQILPFTVEKQKNSILEQIFSVKNDYSNGKKRKVITILGAKIKIKIKRR